MSSSIQRVLYYDREYLRDFDFTDEQSYHLEMRRRLNLVLHLQGIASGLELMAVADADGQYCINPGMAIDGYGREIVLAERYVLSDVDFQTAHIQVGGNYAVCIAYGRTPTTPPSPGYGTCGASGQYTRWAEAPTIQILDGLPDLPDPPQPFDAVPDDPAANPWPVFLGWINVAVASGGAVTIAKITTAPGQRTYVGVRAQSLLAPSAPPPPTAPDPTVYIDADLPITVESNLQERKTLIVGTDFIVDKNSKVTPAPPPPPPSAPDFPGTDGNLKVNNNLFVLGDLYKAAPNAGAAPTTGPNVQWLSLASYIRAFMPDMKLGTQRLDLTKSSPFAFSVSSDNLSTVANAQIYVALSGFDGLDHGGYTNWLAVPPDPGVFRLAVSGQFIQVTPGNPKSCDFTASWSIGPLAGGAPFLTSLTINYLVIFYPPPQ